MGVQVIGAIRAGGIFTLAGARCLEVKEDEEEKRKTIYREKGKRSKEEEKESCQVSLR